MDNGGPPANGGFGGPENGVGGRGASDQPVDINGMISTEAAIAAVGQHDQLFRGQVLHIRQQQVGQNQETLSDRLSFV